MRPDLLVCPGCRAMVPGRIDLRTLALAGDHLVCECGRSYPVVDGVPVVVPDPAALVRDQIDAVENDTVREHISIYMDAHWGEPDAFAPFVDRLASLSLVGLAVELGCSAGRGVAELCAHADHVVGLDLHAGTIRRAHRVLLGEAVPYARRLVGRHYEAAVARAAAPAPNHTLVIGDALDPPLVPGAYDRVVALNLLDSVRAPRQLLSVVDALCRPGGEIILSSPYSWQPEITPEAERFGGADPAAALVEILRTGADLRASYAILDEAELPWTLRRSARSHVAYRVHYLRARKGG